MKDKKTLLIITEEEKVTFAEAVKEAFRADSEYFVIIIGTEEFSGIGKRLLSDRLFKKNGILATVNDYFERKREDRLSEKVKGGVIEFKNGMPSYRKMFNVFIRYNPDVVMINGASLLDEAIAARNKANPEIKIVVATDEYVLDKRLVAKGVDFYYTENVGVLTTLANEGVKEKTISVFECEYQNKSKETPLPLKNAEENSERDKKTILLLAKRNDGNGIISATEEVIPYQDGYKIYVQADTDRKIYAELKTKISGVFNEGVPVGDLVEKADVVVTRPDAENVHAALRENKPLILLPAESTFEKRTAEYLKRQGIVTLEKKGDLYALLDRESNKEAEEVKIERVIETKKSIKELLERLF